MASQQSPVGAQVGSAFSIKNLLNLPDDGKDDEQRPARAAEIHDAPPHPAGTTTIPDNFGHCIAARKVRPTRPIPMHFVNAWPFPNQVLGEVSNLRMLPCCANRRPIVVSRQHLSLRTSCFVTPPSAT